MIDIIAAARVFGSHGKDMFFDRTIRILMMEMSVMQEIDVPVVFDSGVAAAFAVLMIVVFFGEVFFAHVRSNLKLSPKDAKPILAITLQNLVSE